MSLYVRDSFWDVIHEGLVILCISFCSKIRFSLRLGFSSTVELGDRSRGGGKVTGPGDMTTAGGRICSVVSCLWDGILSIMSMGWYS